MLVFSFFFFRRPYLTRAGTTILPSGTELCAPGPRPETRAIRLQGTRRSFQSTDNRRWTATHRQSIHVVSPVRIRYFLKLPPGGADVRSCRGWGRGAARGGRYVACAARIDGPRARDYHRSLAPLPRRPRRLPAGRLRSIATHMHTTVLSIFLRLSVTSIVVVVVFEWLDAVRY